MAKMMTDRCERCVRGVKTGQVDGRVALELAPAAHAGAVAETVAVTA